MTQASPTIWNIVPLIVALTLIVMTVLMWWQFMPKYPNVKPANSSLSLKKQWSWW